MYMYVSFHIIIQDNKILKVWLQKKKNKQKKTQKKPKQTLK